MSPQRRETVVRAGVGLALIAALTGASFAADTGWARYIAPAACTGAPR